jgi:GT2 family glycosyltransferase
MSESVTALPPKDTSSLRWWLRSVEFRVRDWRYKLRCAGQAAWIRRQAARVNLPRLLARLGPREPLTVVCAVESLDAPKLQRCIQSLADQLYPNWRLELVGKAGDGAGLQDVLQRCERFAGRARIHLGEDSAWNAARAIAACVAECHASHVGLLAGDEALADDALAWIAAILDRHPGAAWLYADEASLTENGESVDFHYKPDFSQLYLWARFFTGTFSFYRRDLLLGALNQAEHDGGDKLYDVALRVAENAKPEDVQHIPHVLWFSPPMDPNSPPARQLAERQRESVSAALARRGIPGQVRVHERDSRLHELRFEPRTFPKVSIIIPTRNAAALVKACVTSLRAATRYRPYEIVVIDHQSDEAELRDYLSEQSAQGILRVMPYEGRFNFADMNNQAVALTDGELVLLLNNDIDGFCDGWLEQLVATLQLDERIAAVGPLLYYPDGTIQHAGIFFGMGRTGRHGHVDLPHDALGYCGRLRSLQEVSCLTGAMLLLRRSAFDASGGFDVKYPEDFNDTDLCLRLRQAGWRLAYTPHVTAFHYSSKTRRTKVDHRRIMIQQWGDRLKRDPFYSPHLSARRFEVGELNRVWELRKRMELAAYLSQTPAANQ